MAESYPAIARVLAFATLAAAAWFAPACGTDAVGVEACRTIESKRCEVAPACAEDPTSLGVATEEEVANCKLLYRDHCLNGLENDEEEPDQQQVDGCVAAIDAAAACKRDGTATMATCDLDGASLVGPDDALLTPCEALKSVEVLTACAFVKGLPKSSDGGGGEGGSASASGGGGSGGA